MKTAPTIFSATSTHIILDVRFASSQQENAAGLVVSVLAGKVEGGESSLVLDVHIGLGSH